MSAVYNSDGKKQSDGLTDNLDHWPDEGRHEKVNGLTGKSWWHSDYKDVPYQFTYPFYKKITEQIKK